MRRFQVRITVLLITAIGGLVAIAVGAVLFVSASANLRNTLELIQTRATLTISLVERSVGAHVKPARDLVAHIKSLAEAGRLDISDRSQLLSTLEASLAAAPQVAGVMVWERGGDAYSVSRERGALVTSRVPKRILRELGTIRANLRPETPVHWGPPIYRNREPVITVFGGIFDENQLMGVAAAGLSLTELSSFLTDLDTGFDSTAFILYGDSRVLAHPSMADGRRWTGASREFPLQAIDDLDDPILSNFSSMKAANLPVKAKFEIHNYETDDDQNFVVLSRLKRDFGRVPWRFGVLTGNENVDQQFRRLVGSIGIGAGVLLVSFLLAIILAKRMARPIKATSSAARHIAELNFSEIKPLPRSFIRELDDQSVAFNRMVTGLKWFETYVPRSLVTRLMEAPEGPTVGHREAELTVMFTDIVGFTPLSESMSPDALAGFLNRHFDDVNRCIEAEDGTLDKYIGDAAMAFWGAPEPFPDHAARACRAALALLAAAEAHSANGDGPKVRIKIAIHTGPLIVGNIGATARMNYTVIGDTVNVAARIEKLCAEEDDGSAAIIIVSDETRNAAGEGFNFEALGERSVKGRNKAVKVWRLRP